MTGRAAFQPRGCGRHPEERDLAHWLHADLGPAGMLQTLGLTLDATDAEIMAGAIERVRLAQSEGVIFRAESHSEPITGTLLRAVLVSLVHELTDELHWESGQRRRSV